MAGSDGDAAGSSAAAGLAGCWSAGVREQAAGCGRLACAGSLRIQAAADGVSKYPLTTLLARRRRVYGFQAAAAPRGGPKLGLPALSPSAPPRRTDLAAQPVRSRAVIKGPGRSVWQPAWRWSNGACALFGSAHETFDVVKSFAWSSP